MTDNDIWDVVQNIRDLIRAEISDYNSCSCCGGGLADREAQSLENELMRIAREVRNGGGN